MKITRPQKRSYLEAYITGKMPRYTVFPHANDDNLS